MSFQPSLRHPASSPSLAAVDSHHIALHGLQINFLESGADSGGPLLVLLHGLGSDATTWMQILPQLGQWAHVLAPDLVGCGESDKPRDADYSVGAHAARLRDLLRVLGHDRASVVGHSFGGGVAMSFAYQFPERTQQIGLIATGGLGTELSITLRAASLPGVVSAAIGAFAIIPRWLRRHIHHAVTAAGLAANSDVQQAGGILERLIDPDSRTAFLRTLRSGVSWSGQRLTANDYLCLLDEFPTLLIAGRHDPCIPYRHAVHAHRKLSKSRLQVIDSGHFPQQDCPGSIAQLLKDFLFSTADELFSANPLKTGNRPAERASGTRYMTMA